MKTIPLAVLILLLVSFVPSSIISIQSEPGSFSIDEKEPLIEVNVEREHFIENGGQLSRDDILYYTLGPFRVGFTERSVVFAITDPREGMYSYEMEFSDARDVEPEGIDPEETYYNYMVGEKDRWASGLPCYRKIVYEDLWPGIDLVYYFDENSLKYDLIVEPHADPSDIEFNLIGIDEAFIDKEGDLNLRTPFGTVSDSELVSYQEDDEITTDFVLEEDHLRFRIEGYDRTSPLVIDPLVQYCTYLGGTSSENNNIIDSMLYNGDILISGITYSSNFPVTSGVIDRTSLNGEGFVTRMKGDLGSLVFSTFLGGENTDAIFGMDMDPSGNIYVSGLTFSKQFPITPGVMNETSKIDMIETPWGYEELAPDSFVSKMSSDGTNLVYSTYIAGNHTDYNRDLAVDDDGYAYVISSVASGDLPVKNAYQSEKNGYNDFYLIKMNQNASDFEWATYLGGDDDEWSSEGPTDIKISSSGDVFITGISGSMDFPTTSSAYKQSTSSRWMTGTLTSFNSDGDLIFSTYVHEDTEVTSLEVTNDSVFMTGYTSISDFPVTKATAYDDTLGGWGDAFVLEMDASGSQVKYGTYLGGDEDEYGYDISFDDEGRIMLTGYTFSEDFPLSEHPLDDSMEGWVDSFVTILNLERDDIHFSSFFGGDQDDLGMRLDVDENGGLFLVGLTGSSDLPVHDEAYDKTFSNGDIYISRIKIHSFPPTRPRDLSALRGDGNVTLSWSPPMNDGNETISNYNIYMSQLNRTFELVGKADGNATSFIHEDLDNGERYYYYITAENIVGESPPTITLMRIPATIPTAPEITGYSTGDGSITLEWNDPEDLGGDIEITFNVYMGLTPDEMELEASGLDDFSYTQSDLINGEVYHFAISASNGVGEGPMTTHVSLRPLKIPGPPVNLSYERGHRFVHLSWEPPRENGGEENLEYDILKSTLDSEPETIATTRRLDYNVTDLMNGIYYLFTVIAHNEKGNGPSTSAVVAIPIGAPTEPRDLKADLNDGKAALSWRSPSDFGGDEKVKYNIFIQGPDGEDTLVAAGVDETDYKMSGLVNGLTYTFFVTAVNDLFESSASNTATAICLGPPSAPRNVEVVGGNSEVTISWDPPSDDGGDAFLNYRVFSGTSLTDLSEIGETMGLTHTEKDLKNGKTYYIAVRAFNSFSIGDFSETVMVVPLSVPGIPEIILTTPSDGSIKVDWKAPVNLGGSDRVTYNLYLAPEGSTPLLEKNNITSTSYKLTGLENGIEYTISVSAENQRGEGVRSDSVREIPVTAPGIPLNLTLDPGKGEITVSWTLPQDSGGSPFLEVEIYRWEEGMEPVLLATVDADSAVYVDNNVKDGVRYYYDVIGVTSVGRTPTSETRDAKAGSSDDGTMDLYLPITIAVVIMMVVMVLIILLALRKDKKAVSIQQPPQYINTTPYQNLPVGTPSNLQTAEQTMLGGAEAAPGLPQPSSQGGETGVAQSANTGVYDEYQNSSSSQSSSSSSSFSSSSQ
jgi:fibronectin type 3 domain-containing protein